MLLSRLVVMYVRKARAVLIAIAEPMPRPRCVGRAAERPRCSTTSCEKESEVRSENDSEEEETYLLSPRMVVMRKSHPEKKTAVRASCHSTCFCSTTVKTK